MKILRPYQQEALNKLRSRLKETEYPLLVNASVGAGKSLIIAELLLIIERAGWRALCLTMNSTLISQNAEAYKLQGGHTGIFCAALRKKNSKEPVIFASPQSVKRDIKKEGCLSAVPFNLIIIDECHNINVSEPSTTYMKIFNWYGAIAKDKGHKLRFVGLTGTPYRGKGISIVGHEQFFKEEVCAISAEWLIENKYLTKPVWGVHTGKMEYDFKNLKVNSMGQFNALAVKESIHKKPRLTAEIMQEVQAIAINRRGVFIFATSIEHCHECMTWLPAHESAMITGDTKDETRRGYIDRARKGELKYLVNVNVLCTGVDVPIFDTVVFVRPTESLVLYMQCLGRGLRLHEGKTDCLILDYAGNLERHGDIDNPIINEAIKQKNNSDPEYCIPCYDCKTMNKVTARRCIGTPKYIRCDHYFEFKPCPKCELENDVTARFCRGCKAELVDPNKKLKLESAKLERVIYQVLQARYWVIMHEGNFQPIFCAKYTVRDEANRKTLHFGENYNTRTQQSINIFYGKFVKKHFIQPEIAYKNLDNHLYLEAVIAKGQIKTPHSLEIMKDSLKISKKLF